MNMKHITTLIFAGLMATACNKQIDSIRPLTKIDKEGELASLTGIEETTVGNYTLLQGSGFNNYDVPMHDFAESRGNNVTLQTWGSRIKIRTRSSSGTATVPPRATAPIFTVMLTRSS